MVNIAFERRKAKPLREPRRIDRLSSPPLKAARYQLHATQGTNAPRQGSRIDVLQLIIVRRDAVRKEFYNYTHRTAVWMKPLNA